MLPLKVSVADNEDSGATSDHVQKFDVRGSNLTDKVLDLSTKKTLNTCQISEPKSSGIQEKAVNILKKKLSCLNDKELNPEFFQKLETRSSDDLPVEVVVPSKNQQLQGEGEQESKDLNSQRISSHDSTDIRGSYANAQRKSGGYTKTQDLNEFARDRLTEQRIFKSKDSKLMRGLDSDDIVNTGQKDSSAHPLISRSDNNFESSTMNNKSSWLTIQRQLSQLERQQSDLMNMLQVCSLNLNPALN